jgi:hypothetical protein
MANSTTTGSIIGVDTSGAGLDGTGYVQFNATAGPAILVLEEKKTTESSNSDNGDGIVIGSDSSGSTTPVEVSVREPKMTGIWGSGTSASSGLATLASDSYKREAVTRYGTFIEYTSLDNDAVTISYPADQMFVDIFFKSPESVISPDESSGGSEVVDIGSITVEDSEVASVSDKNLVVVGGSCINKVAAKVLGGK